MKIRKEKAVNVQIGKIIRGAVRSGKKPIFRNLMERNKKRYSIFPTRSYGRCKFW